MAVDADVGYRTVVMVMVTLSPGLGGPSCCWKCNFRGAYTKIGLCDSCYEKLVGHRPTDAARTEEQQAKWLKTRVQT